MASKKLAPKKQTARDQGVPDAYLTATGTFKPGFDARYKSDLVASALDLESKQALMTFTAADATRRLRQRGWESWLTRKQAALAAKAKQAKAA